MNLVDGATVSDPHDEDDMHTQLKNDNHIKEESITIINEDGMDSSSLSEEYRAVQREGVQARNLIKFNVPVQNVDVSPVGLRDNAVPLSVITNSSGDSVPFRRKSSASPGYRSCGKKSRDATPTSRSLCMRARYWGLLMDNLRRTIDEIYSACEREDSDEAGCREVLLQLQHTTHDFQALIDRKHTFKTYNEDQLRHAKPVPIAWDIRNTSPSKPLMKQMLERSLNNSMTNSMNSTAGSNTCWADRVKGSQPQQSHQPQKAQHHQSQQPMFEEEARSAVGQESLVKVDEDGWATVQNRQSRLKTKQIPKFVAKKNRIVNSNLNKQHSKSDNSFDATHKVTKQTNLRTVPVTLQDQSASHCTTTTSGLSWAKRVSSGINVGNKSVASTLTVNSLSRGVQTTDRLQRRQNAPPLMTQRVRPSTALNKSACLQMDSTERERQHELFQAEENKNKEPHDDSEHLVLRASTSAMELSMDYSTGEEEDESQLMKLERELADMESVETALTNELDSARAAMEAESDADGKDAQDSSSENVDAECSSMVDAEDIVIKDSVSKDFSGSEIAHPVSLEDIIAEHDISGSISWELMTLLEEEQMELTVLNDRLPGHGAQMHEKLSNASRKRATTSMNNLARIEEKQAKAAEQRQRVLGERADRVKELTRKVEEVRAQKEAIIDCKKNLLRNRLERAESKRRELQEGRVKKARDEEQKGREIAFIQSLEAEQKQYDIAAKHAEHEQRRAAVAENRRRRQGEKADREAAAEERRRQLQADRQARLEASQEERRRREKDRAEREQVQAQGRLASARARERERVEKLAALEATQQKSVEELRHRIQRKQEETERRHCENLAEKSRKAFHMSVLKHSKEECAEAPPPDPYRSAKICTACNVTIHSELFLQSHLRGKRHETAFIQMRSELSSELSADFESFNLKHILDAPSDRQDPKILADKERQKSMRKRVKKLRQRMVAKGTAYENAQIRNGALSTSSKSSKPSPQDVLLNSPVRAKLAKLVKELRRYLSIPDSGPWVPNRVAALEKCLGEVTRILDKKIIAEQQSFCEVGGIIVLTDILHLAVGPKGIKDNAVLTPSLPDRSFSLATNAFCAALRRCQFSCNAALLSNRAGLLSELLSSRLNRFIPDNFGRNELTAAQLPVDLISINAMQLLSTLLNGLCGSVMELSQYYRQQQDLISYIVSLGVVDRLTVYLSNVRGPLENGAKVAEFVLRALDFLGAMLKVVACTSANNSINNNLIETSSGRRLSASSSTSVCSCSGSLVAAEDATQLLVTIRESELVGLVSLLYGLLLHSSASTRCSNNTTSLPPPKLADDTRRLAIAGLRMLCHLAAADLNSTQAALAEEGTSLQFRHIVSHLLWHCGSETQSAEEEQLLHEVLLAVGYFTVLHADNQAFLQSGQPPTVLQQLCQLPFQYFSDPCLTRILFPTLISCCYANDNNTRIVEQEMSCALLANFIEENLFEQEVTDGCALVNHCWQSMSGGDGGSGSGAATEETIRFSLLARISAAEWHKMKSYFRGRSA